MQTIEKIRNMVMTNSLPDTIRVKEKGDLVILNYTQEVQFENLWTDIEMACRGLIINRKTGEVVARPFDKFFNWGESGRKSDAKIKRVTAKEDGSLVFNYRDGGKTKFSTRGSFDSPQSKWAEEFFNANYSPEIDESWTLLFELIHPDNRIVVDYDGVTDLILLAIRNRFTGEYLPHDLVEKFARKNGFSRPKIFSFTNVAKIIDLCGEIGPNTEGWVCEFEDGQLFKFKGCEYVKLHKLISGLSFKFVLENHKSGNLKQALEIIPDEFKDEVKEWEKQIDSTIEQVYKEVNEAFKKAPKGNRKEYALWCMANVPNLTPYMFLKLDNKPILETIFKCAF